MSSTTYVGRHFEHSRRGEGRHFAPKHPDPLWPLAVLVAVQALLISALIRDSYYYGDDVLTFDLAHQLGFGWSLIKVAVYGHVAPVERLAHLVIVDTWPISYPLGELIIVLLWTSLLAALLWVLRELQVALAPSALILFFAGASTVVANEALYYDQTVFLVPASTCILVVVALFLRWLRTNSRAALIGAYVVFALSFISQERPIVALGYLVVLRYVVVWDRPPARWRTGIKADWWLWLPFAIPALIYVWVYRKYEPHSHVTIGAMLKFARISFEDFMRVIVGMPIAGSPLWVSIVGLLGTISVFALLGWWARHRTSIWKAGVLASVIFVINLYPVMRGVGGAIGAVGVANQLQYYLDALFGLGVAVGVALSPWVPGRDAGDDVLPIRWATTERRVVVGGVAALVLAHCGALAYSLPKVWDVNGHQRQAAKWSGRLIAGLGSENRAGRHVRILAGILPDFYVPAFEAPYNQASAYLPLLPQWHDYASGPVAIIDSSGDLKSVAASDPVQLNAFGPDLSHFFFANFGNAPSDPGETCLQGGNNVEAGVNVELPRPVGTNLGGPLVGVDISMSLDRAASFVLATHSARGWSFAPVATSVPAGQRDVILMSPAGRVDQLALTEITPGSQMCLQSIEVGTVVSAEPDLVGCHDFTLSGFPSDYAVCGRPWK